LIANEQPAFQRTLSGVPLLEVYSYEQYQRATQAISAPRWQVAKPWPERRKAAGDRRPIEV